MPKTVVIGGGISGLAAAYALQKTEGSDANYLLLEASDHLGGKIVTYSGDGFLIEGGPDSFLTQKRAALDLCRELGLGDQLIGSNHTATPSTYVLSKGKLHPMPEGMMLMAPTMILPILRSKLISWPGKLRMGLEIFIGRNTTVPDESLGAFVRRRMGSELLAKIAGPLMAGIHAGDPEALSLRSTFPIFTDMEKTHRSLILGMMKRKKAMAAQPTQPSTSPRPSMFPTLSGGLQQLPDAIAARLNPANVQLNTRVQSVTPDGNQYKIDLADGTYLYAENVVFTTPSYVTADLVLQLDPALAAKLREIRYVSTSTVSLAFRRSEITCDLNGFGFIVPATEGRKINACSWSSTKFSHRAPDDFVLMRVFIGGAFSEPLAEQDDATLIDIARTELREIMGITATPVLALAYRWTKSNPQYNVGHSARIDAIDQLVAAHPSLYLAGAAYRGSGIPDCIQSGVDTAAKILVRQTSSNPAISHAVPAFVAT
jgi:oxygen-dependent protoporphyrinogen oxidase